MFVDASGRLLACDKGAGAGNGDMVGLYTDPAPIVGTVVVRMQSMAASTLHSLALGWDGRVLLMGRQ